MVILFSIDGMRADALLQADTPNIDRLAREGAASYVAQTVMPCCTLPCHTSMLRGVDVPRHGITTNSFHPLVRPVPSLMEVAKSAGLRCGFFYNWGELRDLCAPDSLLVSFLHHSGTVPESDDIVTDAAVEFLKRESLDFLFVYLGHTDESGHMHGWMSEPYMRAISVADRCVGRVLEVAGEATVLVTSDHGGHERTHGTELPEDMTVPWVLSGPGIRQGVEITSVPMIYDVAPTLAHLLGLKQAREWEGRPLVEVLSA